MTTSTSNVTTPTTHVQFPIFEGLDVNDYGLYPGLSVNPGLHLEFRAGLTLIVGTNGLGKTTLVTLLYRMLAGGYELGRDTLQAAELGGAGLEVNRLKPKARGLFADRVSDRAKNARAVLRVRLGGAKLSIERRLDNLGLVSLVLDGETLKNDEETFQSEILRLAGLSSFGDWLIFLRQMVFYFEDRRSLVWDASAQRQMFRILFLPPDISRALYVQERTFLQKDSEVRNLSAALFRLQHRIAQDDASNEGSADLRARIDSLRNAVESDVRRKAEMIEKFDSLDEQRRELRRDLLQTEDLAGRLEDQIEDTRLRLVYSKFPDGSATSKYLLSLLLSERRCAVCDTESPELAETLTARVEELACVLCGSLAVVDSKAEASPIDRARLGNLRHELEIQKRRIEAVQIALQEAASKHRQVSTHLLHLTADIDIRQEQLDGLIALLPSDDDTQMRAKEELGVIKDKIGDDKRALEALGTALSEGTEKLNVRMQEMAESIKTAFARYAGDFLFETAALKWSPLMRRIGQLHKFETASFDLDMSGADFAGVQRRAGPESVSESQREFIDLAFRMALIEVAGQGEPGSLVIDAPESSLDAVFVERAADVLTRFAKPGSENRLLIASNIIDGRLLPGLIRRGIPADERDYRLVNLIELAVPTAAVRRERDAYMHEWEEILLAAGYV
ncbi:MAG TPA: hypothetical protein VLC71_02265 [Thermomonas sp.]|nr:hypothetical protein [Thermomonas sp.]